MKYLIYLRGSLKRRTFRHLALFLILTCAMAMPLMVSIYRNSDLEGTRTEIRETTGGHYIHVENAKEEEFALFTDIPGLTASWDDGTVYLDADAGMESLTDEQDQLYAGMVLERMGQTGNEAIRARSFYGIEQDDSLYRSSGQMMIASWLIAAVALAVFLSSYSNHLRLFRPDIGMLRAMGASRKQVMLIFLAEYILVFLAGGILAFGFAVLVMKLLFVSFLEIRNVPGLSTVIFHLDAGEMLAYLAAFFVIGSIAVCVTVLRFCRQNIVSLAVDGTAGKKARHNRRRLKAGKDGLRTVTGLYLHRLSQVPKECGMLAIPVLAIILFAVNYLAVNMDSVSVPPEQEIRITCYDDYEGVSLLSEEERQAISKLEGIRDYREDTDNEETNYLIRDERAELSEHHYEWIDDTPCMGTWIQCYSASFPDSGLTLGKYEAAVTANHSALKYKVGDTILLQSGHIWIENGELCSHDPILLTVAELKDNSWSDRAVDLYLSDELFSELSDELPVNRISIRLDNPADAPRLAEQLVKEYPSLRGFVSEYWSAYDATRKAMPGMVIMFTVLFGLLLLFLFAVQIIRITENLQEQEGFRDTLRRIGTSRRTLVRAHFRQMGIIALASTALAAALGYAMLLLFFHRTGYHLQFNAPVLSVQLVILLVEILAFLIPVWIIFRKKTSREAIYE